MGKGWAFCFTFLVGGYGDYLSNIIGLHNPSETYGCSFGDGTCPYDGPPDPPSPLLPDFEEKLLATVNGSQRCLNIFRRDYRAAKSYGLRRGDTFKPLTNFCSRTGGHPSGELTDFSGKPSESNRQPRVIFAILLHTEAPTAISLASQLLDRRTGLNSTVVFHVDASAEASTHQRIYEYCTRFPKVAVKIQPSIDVEWGRLSFIDAQLAAMELAVEMWGEAWDSLVFLSGSDTVLAPLSKFGPFFKKQNGKTHLRINSVSDDIWTLMLNDMVTVCDTFSASLGWRGGKTRPQSHGITRAYLEKNGGKLKMGNVQSFMSREFVMYVLNMHHQTHQGWENLSGLRDVLRFTQSADEVVFPTLFANSPLCHQRAKLAHPREFFLYFWPANPAKTGESSLNLQGKSCRRTNFSNPSWFCGLSPLWIGDGDITRVSMYRDTLFVRKADFAHSPRVLKKIQKWIRKPSSRPPPPKIQREFFFRFKTTIIGGRSSCLTVLNDNPVQFQWRNTGCNEEGSLLTVSCTSAVRWKSCPRHKGSGKAKKKSKRSSSRKKKSNSPNKNKKRSKTSAKRNQVASTPCATAQHPNETLCTVRPVRYPKVCLSSRYVEYAVGVDVGFTGCDSYMESQIWRFVSCSSLQLAAAVSDRSYGSGPGEGLCVARSRDGDALTLERCQDVELARSGYHLGSLNRDIIDLKNRIVVTEPVC